MPSIITHAAVPLALWCAADRGRIPPRLLGAGVIAAWMKPGDRLVFYEISPRVIDIAQPRLMLVVESGCPFMNSSITSLIFGEERKSGSLCTAPSIIK